MAMDTTRPRFEMVNVRPGHVIIEQDVKSPDMSRPLTRSYFSAQPVPPIEEYWEGPHQWAFRAMAQAVQFDVRDNESGAVTKLDELLGLLWWAGCPEGSDIHRIGDIAQDNGISLYVAITYESADGRPTRLAPEKVAVLNGLFNGRQRNAARKVLVLPDMFGLYDQIGHGQVMIDFGLTSLD